MGLATVLDSQADAVGQRVKEVAFNFKRKGLAGGRHEEPHDLAVPRDHDRLALLEHLRGAVPEVPDGCRNHVPTIVVTILACLTNAVN